MTALLAASLLRLALLPAIDLMPQSAYYATAYAAHPGLSYYDHPPMIGWLLWLSGRLLGQSALAVHATVFTVTLATQLACHRLARLFLGAEGGRRALTLLATTGMATVLSLVAVPDVPLLLFWALALLALHRALLGGAAAGADRTGASDGPGARPPAWPWLGAGAAMGLAFLSKYTAVFLQGGLVLFLLLSPRHRRLLRTPWPWLALAVAQLVSLPVYLWNARHGFASFVYQSAGRATESRLDLDDALGFLGSQVLLLLPVPLFAFLWAAGRHSWRLARRAQAVEPATLFLLSFSVPVFATCAVLSTVTWVKINWAMPAYVAGLVLAAGVLGRRAVRWHLATAVVLHAVLAVQLVAYPVPLASDDTWFGWRALAREVEARAERYPGAFVFSADNYKTTAELRFYSDLEVYGMNVLGWNALHYGYLGEEVAALAGRDALYIRSEDGLAPSRKTERYLERTRRHFGGVRELEPIRIEHRGRLVRLFRVFHCEGYRGPDPGGG
jgi:4-amino-4-deoxy-L-arabinose transferase-like glycosyltransferase